MDDFLFKLQQLIAKNRIEEVIKILLNTFQKCESQQLDSKDEIRALRNQVVLLSARYNETKEKINSGVIDPVHAGTAKNQQISAFLNIIGKLPEYKELSKYVNGLEEEEAWKEAVRKNDIETYRIFFTKYPQGKYKEETRRIIGEMEAIERTKEAAIKEKAAAEKKRRLEREEKDKAAMKLQKERAENDAEEKVKRAKKELEELEIQKREILNEKQKAKDDLAKMKKKKEGASYQRPNQKPANIPSVKDDRTSNISSTTRRNIGGTDNRTIPSQSFFQKRNWPWFVLPIVISLIISFMLDNNAPRLLVFMIPLLYIFAGIKYPIKPIWFALISTFFTGVGCIVTAILYDGITMTMENEGVFYGAFILFIITSICSLTTLYFRNKNLEKKAS